MSTSGHKSWRYKNRFEKKERLLTLGVYSEVSLAEAREKRDEAKKILREGRDLRHIARRGRFASASGSVKSLENVAREWHALQIAPWKPVHASDVIISLEHDIFPHLRSMPLV